MKNKLNTTKEEMRKFLNESKSLREVILKCGLSPNGSSGYSNIKKAVKNMGLELPKYKYFGDPNKNRRKSNSEVFVANSDYSRSRLKNRIIKQKLIDYRCQECGITKYYNGKEISLHIDHINGVNNDHRLENLRFLCPNCHSQTVTYGGKSLKMNEEERNRKRESKRDKPCKCGKLIFRKSKMCEKCRSQENRKVKNRPSKEELIKELENSNFSALGRKYGVSDNAVRKWIK